MQLVSGSTFTENSQVCGGTALKATRLFLELRLMKNFYLVLVPVKNSTNEALSPHFVRISKDGNVEPGSQIAVSGVYSRVSLIEFRGSVQFNEAS